MYSLHEGEEIKERGFAPLLPTLPLPLLREGGQGDRLLNNLITRTLTNPEWEKKLRILY